MRVRHVFLWHARRWYLHSQPAWYFLIRLVSAESMRPGWTKNVLGGASAALALDGAVPPASGGRMLFILIFILLDGTDGTWDETDEKLYETDGT